MNTTSKFIGSTLIVIGTTIGAGMLALPMVSASAGFFWSVILMTLIWIISTITGLLIIEINLALPIEHSTFNSMAGKTLGIPGKIATWVSYLFLLYAIISAYIIGESDILVQYLHTSFGINIHHVSTAILFTTIFGIAVFWSTKATDYFNRGLISLKGILVIIALIVTIPHIDINKLIINHAASNMKYLYIATPAFISAFCYQFVIPSIRIYIGDNPKQLRLIVITGTTVAFFVYFLWLAATLGVVPHHGENSFLSLAQNKEASVGIFTQLLIFIVKSKWVAKTINGFTIIAMTTSFLGASLGLFDFLADGLKRQNTRWGRLQTAIPTFVPPLLIALLCRKGFVIAINYAAIFVAFLCIVLPAMMAYKVRKNQAMQSPYKVKGGNIMLSTVFLSGIIFILLAILYIFNALPGIRFG